MPAFTPFFHSNRSPLKLVFSLILVAIFAFFTVTPGFGEDATSSDNLEAKQKEIEQLQQELSRIRGEKQTLSTTIQYLDNSIKITQTQINQTEAELDQIEAELQTLQQRIGELDITLEKLSKILVVRINNTYKQGRQNPFISLIASNNLTSLLSEFKYLQNSQRNDRHMLYQLETARLNLDQQKLLKEEKQQELDAKNDQLLAQKSTLDKQQEEKEYLLLLTKNDEKKFQSELSQKLAELEAIQSIIAGRGDETEVGEVGIGDRIASVIPGPSTCSSGGHLHFEVAKNNQHLNPADFISSKSVIWDNSPDTPFSFNGSWSWPLSDTVRITQGFGMTFYASTLRYYGGSPHTGIDMVNSSDYTVRAVQPGTLYRGAISCRGGSLRYVKVEHSDSEYSTFYLHVNY